MHHASGMIRWSPYGLSCTQPCAFETIVDCTFFSCRWQLLLNVKVALKGESHAPSFRDVTLSLSRFIRAHNLVLFFYYTIFSYSET